MPDHYIGLMSGTSLDGIDAVLASVADSPRILHSHYQPFHQDLRTALLALNNSGNDELHRAAVAANHLTHAYAAVIGALLAQAGLNAKHVAAIGCHGQTVRHRPDAGYTVQLINAALLAELTGITVVCDFRSRDIAAGGQGAPLVPTFHQRVFQAPDRHRVIVNIGGIANLTNLPPSGTVTGFDCGPGNILMDAWIAEQLGKPYDEDGRWAAQGSVITPLFDQLYGHEFFERPPPKSTGRDTFHLAWVKQTLLGKEAAADVQATLLALTTTSIARAVTAYCAGAQEVFVCGGGARNRALIARLQDDLPDHRVGITDELGVNADWVEALAFAWLARQTLAREPGNLPAVTGAKGTRILGAIYPA